MDQILHERDADRSKIAITTARLTDAVCTLALQPLEETISLDVLGLEAGVYSVIVNGTEGSFELTQDNALQKPGGN